MFLLLDLRFMRCSCDLGHVIVVLVYVITKTKMES